MDIKELKGTMTLEDFINSMTNNKGYKTLGGVWEDSVTCNNCSHRETCRKLSDKLLDDYNVNITCRQVIDFLLGDLTVEDLIGGRKDGE